MRAYSRREKALQGSAQRHRYRADMQGYHRGPSVDTSFMTGLATHASTLLGVACLGYPGRLVEITAVASVPDE